MCKFKVGNIVKRVMGDHNGMKVGDVGTITDVKFGTLILKEFPGGGNHSSKSFILLGTVEKEEVSKYKFKVGDEVEVLKNKADGSYWNAGETFIVLDVNGTNCRGNKKGKLCDQRVEFKNLRLVNKTGENEMKKVISDTYVKTANALLVQKHLGSQITDNFIGGLVLKQNKIDILNEARRLEEEETKK